MEWPHQWVMANGHGNTDSLNWKAHEKSFSTTILFYNQGKIDLEWSCLFHTDG